jgi:hypothetical protein
VSATYRSVWNNAGHPDGRHLIRHILNEFNRLYGRYRLSPHDERGLRRTTLVKGEQASSSPALHPGCQTLDAGHEQVVTAPAAARE